MGVVCRANGGTAKECVLFSDTVIKINRKGKQQERALVVSEKALYNLMPTDFGECKRRIDLANVRSISINTKNSDEFVVHVPSEYDYHFCSPKRMLIVNIIQSAAQSLQGDLVPINETGKADCLKEAGLVRNKQ